MSVKSFLKWLVTPRTPLGRRSEVATVKRLVAWVKRRQTPISIAAVFAIVWATVLAVYGSKPPLFILSGCSISSPGVCAFVDPRLVYLGSAYLVTALAGLRALVRKVARPRASAA